MCSCVRACVVCARVQATIRRLGQQLDEAKAKPAPSPAEVQAQGQAGKAAGSSREAPGRDTPEAPATAPAAVTASAPSSSSAVLIDALSAESARLQRQVDALGCELAASNAAAANAAAAAAAATAAAAAPRMTSYDQAWDRFELDRLRNLVSERDREVSELASHLELLRARAAGAGPGPPVDGVTGQAEAVTFTARGDGGPASGEEADEPAVAEVLRRRLAQSEATLRDAQERLAVLEARAAMAQASAGRGEGPRDGMPLCLECGHGTTSQSTSAMTPCAGYLPGPLHAKWLHPKLVTKKHRITHVTIGPAGEERLDAAHRGMVSASLEHQRLVQEAEEARATAGRLNARVSELVLAEQVTITTAGG